ncbi:MAG: hypothetical protein FJX55_20215, partial [Alphaproteobacteria bacterium]|nr:hypothetical protein [Alphaproteobacteria bacterium]
ELVDVHRVDALAQALVLGAQPLDRGLVLASLVGVAGLKRLAPYKRPAEIVILETLPASATGKILKGRLTAAAQTRARQPQQACYLGTPLSKNLPILAAF